MIEYLVGVCFVRTLWAPTLAFGALTTRALRTTGSVSNLCHFQ